MKKNFNKDWQFRKNETGPWVAVEIPHDWLIGDVNRLYESGIGYYRKNFDFSFLKKGQRAILEFDGIYMDSSLFVNDVLVGEWKNGYTAFQYDITDFLHESSSQKFGENRLLVKVNYISPNSRWYSGAGIYRDCWLHVKNAVHFLLDGIYITPKKETGGKWKVLIDAEVNTTNQNYEIRHQILNEKYETQADGNLLVENPRVWDIDDPFCYTLRSQLFVNGEVTDSVDTRFGFREIAFTPNDGFFLNGRRVKIFGVCQHHDLGALGSAFHKDALRRQFLILKEMGTNAIRTAHNPPARDFMELADEMGFLVMSELTDMWLRPKTQYDYARFFNEWIEKDVASWIRRDRNCPSVIMWSVGNEIYDTHADAEDGSKTLARLMELVKKHDPNGHATVTFCSNYMPWKNTQVCAGIIKLIGYNYADNFYDSHHEEHPDWIIYGGETCSTVQSRGVYHFPLSKSILADDDLQCSSLGNSSTSWGAKSTEACVIADRDAKFSLGQFLWSGTDYIGEPTPYHTKNSYFGQIDTAGFPKDSFYIFKSAWTDYKKSPMIHLFPYWDFSPGQLVDVRVCSNAPKVELFLNGQSKGVQKIDHEKGASLVANYILPYEKGTIKAVAYDEAGTIIAETSRHSFGDTDRLSLKNTRIGELIFTEITALDSEGNPVENACDRVKVSANGGTLLGLDNGDSTDKDQYKTGNRRLFNGKLLAIVREEGTGKREQGTEVRDEGDEDVVSVEIDKTDIAIRKIELSVEELKTGDGCYATAKIFPQNATYRDLHWRLTDASGIDSPLGSLSVSKDGMNATITPKGDGQAMLRCATKNGKEHVSLISLYPINFEGYGKPFLDPYQFISGGLYNLSNVPMTNGNERGIATLRDGDSHVGFADLDFGSYGSDEVTMWLFPLASDPFPVEIWEGMPENGGTRICTVTYDKGSVWNTYQEATYKLPKRFRGVTTFCLVFRQKVHVKGFQFTVFEKAWQEINFADYSQIYGDSFKVKPPAVEKIGNNVVIVFDDMNFGEEGAKNIELEWRSRQDKNSVRLDFIDKSGDEITNMIVLPSSCDDYKRISLPLDTTLRGKGTLRFVFLPGCNIDLRVFRFC